MKYLFFFLTILLACQSKSNVTPVVFFDGKWIEITNKTDTITFDQTLDSNGKRYFILSRAKETRNGFLLPKIGAGIYEYHVNGEKISLYNLISSCYCFKDYHLTLSVDKMLIGNFYDPNSNGVQETFEKIK